MRRKNLFLSLSPNKRNYKVGIYEGSSIVIFGTVFIVAYRGSGEKKKSEASCAAMGGGAGALLVESIPKAACSV